MGDFPRLLTIFSITFYNHAAAPPRYNDCPNTTEAPIDWTINLQNVQNKIFQATTIVFQTNTNILPYCCCYHHTWNFIYTN